MHVETGACRVLLGRSPRGLVLIFVFDSLTKCSVLVVRELAKLTVHGCLLRYHEKAVDSIDSTRYHRKMKTSNSSLHAL